MTLYIKLDVAFCRDLRMLEVGPLARLAYVQAVCYCRENLTDGVIARRALPLVAHDMGDLVPLMSHLAEVGLLDVCGDGWCVPPEVWARWNPTKAEVDGARSAEAQRKAAWRARRDGVPQMSQRDTRAAHGTRDLQPEPEPEPEITTPLSPPKRRAPRGTSKPKLSPGIAALGRLQALRNDQTPPEGSFPISTIALPPAGTQVARTEAQR